MITAIVISLIADTREMTEDCVWLPLQPDKIARRVIHNFCKIKQSGTYCQEEMELQMSAYFHARENCLLFRKPTATDDQSEMEEGEAFVTKEILSAPGIIYMETVPGSSKTKENIIRVKTLLEFRVFLKALGIPDVTKIQKVQDLLNMLGATTEELRYKLSEKFDSRIYTKASVEDTMDIDMLDLMQDVPYTSQVLDAIFSINPYQYTQFTAGQSQCT